MTSRENGVSSMRPSPSPPERVVRSRELGGAKRPLDIWLGSGAVVPLALLAVAAWAAPGSSVLVRDMAAVWSGALLAFFAGVRRGLTFSETSGGRWAELTTMLALYFAGVVVLLSGSVLLGAAGLAAVGALDAVAGRRLEAPALFRWFRPIQMGACVVLLVAILLAT